MELTGRCSFLHFPVTVEWEESNTFVPVVAESGRDENEVFILLLI